MAHRGIRFNAQPLPDRLLCLLVIRLSNLATSYHFVGRHKLRVCSQSFSGAFSSLRTSPLLRKLGRLAAPLQSNQRTRRPGSHLNAFFLGWFDPQLLKKLLCECITKLKPILGTCVQLNRCFSRRHIYYVCAKLPLPFFVIKAAPYHAPGLDNFADFLRFRTIGWVVRF